MKKLVQVGQHMLTLHGHPVALGTATHCQAFGGHKIIRHVIGGNPVAKTVLTKEAGSVPVQLISGLKWEVAK